MHASSFQYSTKTLKKTSVRIDFAVQVLDKIDDDENYLSEIVFSDMTSFHIS